MEKKQQIIKYIREHDWIDGTPECVFLASGEYNENYLVTVDGRRFVFRINHGTQLGLENQIEYEFKVLQAVEGSGVTPRPFFWSMDVGSLGNGVLLMEYIQGRPLDYRSDLIKAATIFARIHSLPTVENMICQQNPLQAICRESLDLLKRYPVRYFSRVHSLLLRYHDKLLTEDDGSAILFADEKECIVNTEVNSGNFIINENRSCLVDWEKAVISCRYQDLAHFLLPTTTLWKTDVRLLQEERELFLGQYAKSLDVDLPLSLVQERTRLLERIILLRALSWCFMAYHEYKDNRKALVDTGTLATITSYLNEAECFLK